MNCRLSLKDTSLSRQFIVHIQTKGGMFRNSAVFLIFSLSLILHPACSLPYTIPVKGGYAYGEYYVDVYIGNQVQALTPTTRFEGIVLGAEQFSMCQNCRTHPDYSFKQSETFQQSMRPNCSYLNSSYYSSSSSYKYACQTKSSSRAGGNRSAFEGQQILKWTQDTNQSVPLRILFTENINSTQFLLKSNGVLGLKRTSNKYFVQNWLQIQKHRFRKFALCYSAEGGTLQLGDVDHSQGSHKVVVPLDTRYNDYYFTKLSSFKIGDLELCNNKTTQQIYIDHSEPSTLLPFDQYAKLKEHWSSECANTSLCTQINSWLSFPYPCFNIQGTQAASLFSPFTIKGTGFTLKWNPQHYLRPIPFFFNNKELVEDQSQIYCAGIGYHHQNEYVLGQSWLLDRKVSYILQDHEAVIENYPCNPSQSPPSTVEVAEPEAEQGSSGIWIVLLVVMLVGSVIVLAVIYRKQIFRLMQRGRQKLRQNPKERMHFTDDVVHESSEVKAVGDRSDLDHSDNQIGGGQDSKKTSGQQ